MKDAIRAFREGRFVLLHDSPGRENEVDLAIPAEAVGPGEVEVMRRDGGGLICVALHPRVAKNFGLPYLTEIFEAALPRFPVLAEAHARDIPYGDRSAFSISVNHRKTYTGVTDEDRALTISRLGRLGRKAMDASVVKEFGREFRSPGHVHLLRAADGLVVERAGHTEMAVALAELAGVTPVVAVCEMLDGRTHRALPLEAARVYAEGKGLVIVEGEEILRAMEGGESG